MDYTVENLPKEYKEYFLLHLQNDENYQRLEQLANEAVHKAVDRAVMRSNACVQLRDIQDRYLRAVLKNCGTDEAVDKLYTDSHISFLDVKTHLPENDARRFELLTHSMLFVIDLLDTHVASVNEIIHRKYPTHDFNLFNSAIELAKVTKEVLKDFHKDKCEEHAYMFADEADEIHELIENRVSAFLERLSTVSVKPANQNP